MFLAILGLIDFLVFMFGAFLLYQATNEHSPGTSGSLGLAIFALMIMSGSGGVALILMLVASLPW